MTVLCTAKGENHKNKYLQDINMIILLVSGEFNILESLSLKIKGMLKYLIHVIIKQSLSFNYQPKINTGALYYLTI